MVSRIVVGIRVVCAIGLLAVGVAPGAAQPVQPMLGPQMQGPPQQQGAPQPGDVGTPFAGLFGATGPKDKPQSLDFRGSVFALYDDNLLANAPGSTPLLNLLDPRAQSGTGSGFDADLSYGFRRQGRTNGTFEIAADASVREISSGLRSNAAWFPTGSAQTNYSAKLTNKITAGLGADASYFPFYQYLPFLAGTATGDNTSPVSADAGFAVDSTRVEQLAGSAFVSDSLTRRSTIRLDTQLISWKVSDSPDHENMRLAALTFTHDVARRLAFHVGYDVQQWQTPHSDGTSGWSTTNYVDVGLGYGDGLTIQFARHYTLTTTIGLAIAKLTDPALLLKTNTDTAFLVTGAATLSRSLGRTWSTSVGYNRGMSYIVGYFEPIVTDTGDFGISGPLSRRLLFSAGAGASRGLLVFTNDQSVTSYTASTRVTYALSPHFGLYAQASYDRYHISSSSNDLAEFGVAPNLSRRSYTVGLTTWVPIIQQKKRGSRDTGQTVHP